VTLDDRLLAELVDRSRRRRRVRIDQVWQAFAAVAPELQGRATSRADLRAALDRLAERAAIELPRTRWDETRDPPLPAYVSLPGSEAAPVDPRAVAWVPELRFVADLAAPPDLDALVAINAFLSTGGRERPRVPARERSLELFGDEKRLDSLVRRSWFERVGLALIRAEDVPPPLVWERGAPGRPILVVENHHTWFSFARWNADARAYGAVCYGAGKAFFRTAPFLDFVRAEVGADRIEYFGDLDGEGLAIPARTWREDRRIAPASRWYARLLELGTPGPGDGEVPEDGIAWLGPHGAAARELLGAGLRLAQEAVGTECLRSETGT
jgi:hypothetical protein